MDTRQSDGTREGRVRYLEFSFAKDGEVAVNKHAYTNEQFCLCTLYSVFIVGFSLLSYDVYITSYSYLACSCRQRTLDMLCTHAHTRRRQGHSPTPQRLRSFSTEHASWPSSARKGSLGRPHWLLTDFGVLRKAQSLFTTRSSQCWTVPRTQIPHSSPRAAEEEFF